MAGTTGRMCELDRSEKVKGTFGRGGDDSDC